MNHMVHMVWNFFFLFTFTLPGECFYLEQEGGIVNRETIIQTEDTGSRPYVGKHLSYWGVREHKCRIAANFK